MKRRWYPPHDSTTYAYIRADKLPPIGSVIAFNRRALEILRYDERDDGWIAQVRRIHGPKLKSENDRAECGLRLRNFAILDVYKGRIPLRSCCGDPWPCTREIAEREAREDMQHLAGQMEKAHDGFCYSCGEPITTRQGKVLAPEANIELPGFPPPGFHTRWKCRGGLAAYDQKRRQHLGSQWAPLVSDQPSLN